LETNAVLRRNGGSTVVNANPAIGDLALLGDTRTAALADGQGRIVWLCLPHFDGEPVFGALIAGPGGGQFRLGPIDQAEVIDRRYRPGSTVLETTWRVGSAEMLLTEA
jgi:GH15 family glucan-1,4-alpha-glucosidase